MNELRIGRSVVSGIPTSASRPNSSERRPPPRGGPATRPDSSGCRSRIRGAGWANGQERDALRRATDRIPSCRSCPSGSPVLPPPPNRATQNRTTFLQSENRTVSTVVQSRLSRPSVQFAVKQPPSRVWPPCSSVPNGHERQAEKVDPLICEDIEPISSDVTSGRCGIMRR